MTRPLTTCVWLLVALLSYSALPLQAEVFDQAGIIRPTEFSDPELEERYRRLGQELRCPKCQNQSVGDSDSPIALDLRREIRTMLEQGMTDNQIKDFLQQRYGDYILYQPRLQGSTMLLWGLPVAMLVLGLSVILIIARRQRQTVVGLAPDEQALEALLRDDGPLADKTTADTASSQRSKDLP